MKLKSTLILFVALSMVSISIAQVKNDSIPEDETATLNTLRESICTELSVIKENTEQTDLAKTDWDDWYLIIVTSLSLSIAAISIIFDFRTMHNTRSTREAVMYETDQKQIKAKSQENLLLDLIRHLYRNKIIVSTLRWKLNEEDKETKTQKYNTHYPSEEHLLKLKVLPEDLRLDRFENAPEHYGELHKLELSFRNYNIEIDVVLNHLKQQNLPVYVKERDLDTLEFKSGYLTDEIGKLMNSLELPSFNRSVLEIESYDKIHDQDGDIKSKIAKVMNTDNFKKWEQENFAVVPKRREDDYYDVDLAYAENLNKDIAIEYLKEGTINLIKF